MTRLSVNLNKVALLRNQRDLGYPSVLESASSVLAAGADGITVHPRQDGRHIRPDDVRHLADLLRHPRHARAEFNVEGYPSPEFLALVAEVRPDQVTLVPDPPEARTSDTGWDFDKSGGFLEDVLAELRELGARTALFIDPDAEAPVRAAAVGADRVELYTGAFAAAYGRPGWVEVSERHYRAARAARLAGIGLNAGHDLNRSNLGAFLGRVPWCLEVSIGHAITSDALQLGWPAAVAAYRAIIAEAGGSGRADGGIEPRMAEALGGDSRS